MPGEKVQLRSIASGIGSAAACKARRASRRWRVCCCRAVQMAAGSGKIAVLHDGWEGEAGPQDLPWKCSPCSLLPAWRPSCTAERARRYAPGSSDAHMGDVLALDAAARQSRQGRDPAAERGWGACSGSGGRAAPGSAGQRRAAKLFGRVTPPGRAARTL